MLIGRNQEILTLKDAVNDNKSHFIAVYGRRRIGKTFLIKEVFNGRFTFQHTGLFEGGYKNELFAFDNSLKSYGYSFKNKSKNWLEAFEKLKELLKQSNEKKKIVFIDELSWMDTNKSGLICALEYFWNGWASLRNDIVLIVCASATSWIMDKVIHNKGGLYNRLTEQIHLKQFTLKECEEYAKSNGIVFNREQILQAYMALGGVPYYWSLIKKGYSIQQNINRLFFEEDAILKDEFKYLYSSIFNHPEDYIKIIQALGTKKTGMTREEIISETKLENSGDLSTRLEELECCGFIRKYYSFGMKKKGVVYQLIDLFTLFYYKFINNSSRDHNYWLNIINNPIVNTWNGLAFEMVAMIHITSIKKKLGITGVETEVNSWYCKKNIEKGIEGTQIDLLIVRKDKVINICEIKYSDAEYTICNSYEKELKRKISDFIRATETRYSIYPTLITTYGLIQNEYSSIIQNVIVLDDLFE